MVTKEQRFEHAEKCECGLSWLIPLEDVRLENERRKASVNIKSHHYKP
jgi:hypothetical protein